MHGILCTVSGARYIRCMVYMGYRDIRILKYENLGVLGWWDIQILGYLDIRVLRYWGIAIFSRERRANHGRRKLGVKSTIGLTIGVETGSRLTIGLARNVRTTSFFANKNTNMLISIAL